jgi:hypothetical protein
LKQRERAGGNIGGLVLVKAFFRLNRFSPDFPIDFARNNNFSQFFRKILDNALSPCYNRHKLTPKSAE